ncbi:MAG TPA: HAD-IIB family hydrolase [Planococcus sp. (in: firmicutes)]|nr:HAD-IIB family hydrolase [Planococcus sp. (in: firmicutes)]
MNKATHILATDLDGTLVGDKESLQNLWHFYEAQVYRTSLVYITGRHFESALSLINEESLPVPDVLVTDVGTEIHLGRKLVKDLDWLERMEQNWQPRQIQILADKVPGLTSQQLPVTNRCSYYAENAAAVELFGQRLTEQQIPHKLIYSGGRDVDILPAGSGKGQALQYILEKFGLSDSKLLVAGDSGNDAEMLTLGFPSVIVGNAQPELLQQADHPSIYRSAKTHAGGIHEAWTYFYSE